jgi:hypothetical protein
MSNVIAKFDISASSPSVVGGTGTTIKRFVNRPPARQMVGPGVTIPVNPNHLQDQLLLPFSGAIDGQRFEVYISGSVSAAVSRVTYLIQENVGEVTLAGASHTPRDIDIPFTFSLGLLGHSATGTMIGSFEGVIGGVLTKGAITPFPVRQSLSLSVGVIFENSAEASSASLTEFKVQKS